MEGVVSFWGESCTNHVGRLACLTGPLEVHQSPLTGPIQPFGHRNSQRSRREVGRGKSATLANQTHSKVH